ncbi:MAG: hypothetical protein AAGI08_13445 [Bacteroidota bacterium]
MSQIAPSQTEPAGSNRIRSAVTHPGVQITQRVLLAVVGGYYLSAAAVTLFAALLATLGMVRSEAVVLSMMLGFLFYLGLLIWAFAAKRLVWLWLVLGAGTLAATGLVSMLG